MKVKSALLVLLVLWSMCGLAQTNTRAQRGLYSISPRNSLQHYGDSLKLFGDSLFRPEVKAPNLLMEEEKAALFLPLTFYKSVAHHAFSLDDFLSDTDSHLLDIYLHRPDMVLNTETRLEEVGPILAPATVVNQPQVHVEELLPQEIAPAAIDMVVLKPNFWTYAGDYYLQFLQNYISGNWYKGGESNYSMTGSATFEANYNNKQKVKWDNKLELKIGLQTTKSDSVHSIKNSEDLIRYTGKLGLQATKKWYYTFQLITYTQFMRNYTTNTDNVISDFLSPLNINVSLGMDYTVDWFKNRLTGTIHLAPVAYNVKYVGRLALSTRYGLDEGRHSLHDFGSLFTVDMKWKFSDNILWQTRLYGYTTYGRAELEWENTFTFQFNRYISTKLFIYPRFDDSTTRDGKHGYFQFKEYISLGFSYSF